MGISTEGENVWKEAASETLRPRRKGFEEEKRERSLEGMRPGGQRLRRTWLGRPTRGQEREALGGPRWGRRLTAACRVKGLGALGARMEESGETGDEEARGSRSRTAGAAVAAASPGARTHVLPPAESARLSSCWRLVGAGFRPHAWSGLLSPGAPTPRHCSPRAAGTAYQPPQPPRPSLRHPGPPHRLLRCKPTRSRDRASSTSSGSAGGGGGGRVDGAPRGTRTLRTRTPFRLKQRPCSQARAAQSPGTSPPHLWAQLLAWRLMTWFFREKYSSKLRYYKTFALEWPLQSTYLFKCHYDVGKKSEAHGGTKAQRQCSLDGALALSFPVRDSGQVHHLCVPQFPLHQMKSLISS